MDRTLPISAPAAAAPAGRLALPLAAGLAVLALAASAQVRVPLPFTPVPVTLQTAVVALCAALLPSRAAVSAVLAYLALGALGAPVYSGFGAGLAHLAGPTGGYLAGFVLAAAWVGSLPTLGRPWPVLALMLLSGEALIHLCGVLWLSRATGTSLSQAFVTGSLVFLPAAAAKLALVTAFVRLYGPQLARRIQNAKNDAD